MITSSWYRKFYRFGSVIFIFAMVALGGSQEICASITERVSVGHWKMMELQGMSYRLLLPRDYSPRRRYPVLLFLHGQGQDLTAGALVPPIANDFFNTQDFRTHHPAIVIAPQCVGSQDTTICSWGGAQAYPRNGELGALAITRWVTHHYSVDRRRIYITGLSLGGNGVWDMIWRYNNVFAAALPVAGATWYWGVRNMSALLRTPIWAAHGEQDPEVPPTYDESNYAEIRSLGGTRMKFTEYPGMGHDVWDKVYADPSYMNWLFAQSKTNK